MNISNQSYKNEPRALFELILGELLSENLIYYNLDALYESSLSCRIKDKPKPNANIK
jgi:hypothetical protein